MYSIYRPTYENTTVTQYLPICLPTFTNVNDLTSPHIIQFTALLFVLCIEFYVKQVIYITSFKHQPCSRGQCDTRMHLSVRRYKHRQQSSRHSHPSLLDSLHLNVVCFCPTTGIYLALILVLVLLKQA